MLVNLSTQESEIALDTDKQGNLTIKAKINSNSKDLDIFENLTIYTFTNSVTTSPCNI